MKKKETNKWSKREGVANALQVMHFWWHCRKGRRILCASGIFVEPFSVFMSTWKCFTCLEILLSRLFLCS